MVSKVEDFRLNLLGKKITPATVAKDLGVVLDPCLTYNDHISSTVSVCMVRLGQINRHWTKKWIYEGNQSTAKV